MISSAPTRGPRRVSLAQENAAKIAAILKAESGYADLYRTIEAGPSGQRGNLLVGRVRYLTFGRHVFEIIDITTQGLIGPRAGYASLTVDDEWIAHSYDDETGAERLIGHASSLAVAVDVLVNGRHAATGRHDSRRISGSFRPVATAA